MGLHHLLQKQLYIIHMCIYLEDRPRTCKWLGSPIYKSFRHLEEDQPYLEGTWLTMVINNLLTGMILQVYTYILYGCFQK